MKRIIHIFADSGDGAPTYNCPSSKQICQRELGRAGERLLSMAAANSSPQPSLSWRIGSSITMSAIGVLSRLFMFGANRTEVHGLEGFSELLDEREDIKSRKRGLITGEHVRSSISQSLIP